MLPRLYHHNTGPLGRVNTNRVCTSWYASARAESPFRFAGVAAPRSHDSRGIRNVSAAGCLRFRADPRAEEYTMADEVACRSTSPNSHQTQPPANHRILGRMDWLDAGRHGFRHLCTRPQSGADRVASEVRVQGHTCQRWVRGIDAVRALPRRMGTVADLGTDCRQVWPQPGAGCHHLRLCDLHRRCRVVADGVAVGIVPLAGGHRNWRRMGAGGYLRRRSLAGRPPQDGRRISADWLLLGLLSGFGPQLHGGSALWLARHVLVRPDARRGCRHGSAARKRARSAGNKKPR